MGKQHAPSEGVDLSVPSVARIYDYAIGGKDNFEVDREAASQIAAFWPNTYRVSQQNRSWLYRAVHYVAEQGVTQFLDNGSGLPTQWNVHQIAQSVRPDARVVYVDNDPTVLAYGRALLDTDGQTEVVQQDMADCEGLLAEERVRGLLDLTKPVAVLYVSVLHCLPDERDPLEIPRRIMDAVPSGSYLILSHLVGRNSQSAEALTNFFKTKDTTWGRVRSEDEVVRCFDGLEVCSPGLGDIYDWRPDLQPTTSDDEDSPAYAAPPAEGEDIYEFGGVAKKV